jgi:hypothetical protein
MAAATDYALTECADARQKILLLDDIAPLESPLAGADVSNGR